MENEGKRSFYLRQANTWRSIVDESEKSAFVFETFLQLQADGVSSVACGPNVCRFLEELVSWAGNDAMVLLLKAFSRQWSRIIRNAYAHHLLHKAILRCCMDQTFSDPIITDLLQCFVKHMSSNIDKYLNHPQGHHSLRLYLQVASGVNVPKDPLTNTYLVNTTLFNALDDDYVKSLEDLIQRFLLGPDVHSHCRDTLLCPFLQILVIVANARGIALLNESIKTIIEVTGLFTKVESDSLPEGFTHPTLVYFTETLLTIMLGKQFRRFLRQHILSDQTDQPKPICEMISHPTASRLVRAVIRRLSKLQDLEEIFDALTGEQGQSIDGISDAIQNGQHAVVNDFAAVCSQEIFASMQKRFLKILYKAFEHPGKKPPAGSGEDPLIRCIVSLKKPAQLSEEHGANDSEDSLVGSVTLPGALLAQTLLRYEVGHPTVLAASLCTQSNKRLFAWAKHPMLSRVIEAALNSPSVSHNRKTHLLSVFEHVLFDLACTRFGSRVVESLWTCTEQLEQTDMLKERLASSLSKKRYKLNNNQFGRFVHQKLQLNLFADSPDLWRRRVLLQHGKGTSSKRSNVIKENNQGERLSCSSYSLVDSKKFKPDVQKFVKAK